MNRLELEGINSLAKEYGITWELIREEYYTGNNYMTYGDNPGTYFKCNIGIARKLLCRILEQIDICKDENKLKELKKDTKLALTYLMVCIDGHKYLLDIPFAYDQCIWFPELKQKYKAKKEEA